MFPLTLFPFQAFADRTAVNAIASRTWWAAGATAVPSALTASDPTAVRRATVTRSVPSPTPATSSPGNASAANGGSPAASATSASPASGPSPTAGPVSATVTRRFATRGRATASTAGTSPMGNTVSGVSADTTETHGWASIWPASPVPAPADRAPVSSTPTPVGSPTHPIRAWYVKKSTKSKIL